MMSQPVLNSIIVFVGVFLIVVSAYISAPYSDILNLVAGGAIGWGMGSLAVYAQNQKDERFQKHPST